MDWDETQKTNGSYREFPTKLRDASEASTVRGLKWGGHYLSNHLRDAANEIERLRAIVRVNALRNGSAHGEIDHVLFGSYLSAPAGSVHSTCLITDADGVTRRLSHQVKVF